MYTLNVSAQGTVTGTVVSSDDGYPIPGVTIVEKGTSNGTVTDAQGNYSLVVESLESTLTFMFVGFVPQERALHGRSRLDIVLKTDCIRDWFDAQKIGVYLNSGLINNPVGGQLDFSFPAYFRMGTLATGLGYQTDLNENERINLKVELLHFASTCDFDLNGGWYHRQVEFGDHFNVHANSVEANLNFNRFGFIAGYSHLKCRAVEVHDNTLSGVLVGVRTWLNGPLRLSVTGKASVYSGTQEYFGEIRRDSKYINVFLNFYRLEDFHELSLGVGTDFWYRLRKQKK